jgi:two-component system chemotaxis response regulator CheY
MIKIGIMMNAGIHLKPRKESSEMTSVIVVDDDRDTVEVFCEYLAIKDIKVLGKGYDGRTAVDLYKQHKPDVVLLDVMMPDYDGFYGLEQIRKINPNAKIIMVTADLTSDTERKLVDLKASAMIYKPYEIDSVIETIEKVHKDNVVLSTTPPN